MVGVKLSELYRSTSTARAFGRLDEDLKLRGTSARSERESTSRGELLLPTVHENGSEIASANNINVNSLHKCIGIIIERGALLHVYIHTREYSARQYAGSGQGRLSSHGMDHLQFTDGRGIVQGSTRYGIERM